MAKKSGKSASKKKLAAKPTARPKKVKPQVKPAVPVRTGPRRLKPPQYSRFRPHRPIKHPVKLPNVFKLSKVAAATVLSRKKLFGGIILVYGLLNLILVQGIAGHTDLTSLKDSFDQIFTGDLGSLASGVGVFASLLGSAGNASSDTAGAYQIFLGIVGSLAVIWALRQVLAGTKLRIRDPYYRGMYPLIPFMLVILVVGLQLVPMLIGAGLYSIATNTGIASPGAQQLLWVVLCGALILLSLYLLASSLFALYIVTLPDMTPLKALRSARRLVRYRRWTVMRKIVALPIILLAIAAIIMVPIIIWLTALAQWVFFILTMFALLAAHSYMYTLYRELLNE
jgi:hypothetical protein